MDAMLREHKKAERELMKKGKKPFHIKKCEIHQDSTILSNMSSTVLIYTATQRKIELAQKYSELKKSGKLKKFMSKKRKKNSSRDRKRLPFK